MSFLDNETFFNLCYLIFFVVLWLRLQRVLSIHSKDGLQLIKEIGAQS